MSCSSLPQTMKTSWLSISILAFSIVSNTSAQNFTLEEETTNFTQAELYQTKINRLGHTIKPSDIWEPTSGLRHISGVRKFNRNRLITLRDSYRQNFKARPSRNLFRQTAKRSTRPKFIRRSGELSPADMTNNRFIRRSRSILTPRQLLIRQASDKRRRSENRSD
jgi:hypothetical protein